MHCLVFNVPRPVFLYSRPASRQLPNHGFTINYDIISCANKHYPILFKQIQSAPQFETFSMFVLQGTHNKTFLPIFEPTWLVTVCFSELLGAVCCWPESLRSAARVYQCFTAGHGSCFTVAVSCRGNPSSMPNHFQEQRKQITLHKGREVRSKIIHQ